MKYLQNIRGTRDIFGKDILILNNIIDNAKLVLKNYNFCEINTPIIEFEELFSSNLGNISDVVNKEMYSFLDKSNNKIVLRPEMTSPMVRHYINNPIACSRRIFSYGPNFRYERPQMGRHRQFLQMSCEIMNTNSLLDDVDCILMLKELLTKSCPNGKFILKINSIGGTHSRDRYKKELVAYFTSKINELSEISKFRLTRNPLRILDSKEAGDINLCKEAPSINDFLDNEESNRFNSIINILTLNGIQYTVDDKIVRGLDYYNNLVFEFVNEAIGSQNSVAAGGRYTFLCGKKNIDGVGFAIGLDRLMLVAGEDHNFHHSKYLISLLMLDINYAEYAYSILNLLRSNNFNSLILWDKINCKLSKLLERASSLESNLVVIIGDDEVQGGFISIKNMLEGKQYKVTKDNLISFLQNI